MTERPGHGLLPDLPHFVRADNVTRPLSGLVGAAPVPVGVDRRQLLDRVLDQGATNACVGCALSTAIYLRGQMQGGVKRPSAKAIYDMARLVDMPGGPLMDVGCRPRAAILGIQEHGLVAWDAWKLPVPGEFDAPDIDAQPPFDVFANGADALLTAYYRADSGDVVNALKQAIAMGHFPVFGMYVPPAYYGWAGRDVFKATDGAAVDRTLGAHMQAACGYDDEALHVVSSWGTRHGDSGIVRISWGFIDSAWCFDRLVINTVPTGIR